MGYAIESLKRSWGTATDHPSLIVGIGGASLVGTLLSSMVGLVPLIGALLSWIVVTPAILAAVLSMAAGAVDDDPSYDDLWGGIREHWTSLAGAYATLVGVVVAFGLMAGAVSVAAFSAAGGSLSSIEDGTLPSIGPGLAVAFAAIGLVFVLVFLVVQFVDVSIVFGGAGVLEAFGVAWRVVRAEPVSVLGYSILRGLVTFGPIAVVWALSLAVVESIVGKVLWLATGLAVLGSVVVGAVALALGIVYHVTYFARLDEERGFAVGNEPDADEFGDAASWGSDAGSSA